MIETIQQAVKSHDKYQIEIKLDYEVLDDKETRYRIATYFFIPQSLDISANTYSKQQFYSDVKNYIRLKTPILNLRDLIEYEQSPLCQIEQIVALHDWAHREEICQQLITNFKLLSAILKSAIREHFSLIEERIEESVPGSKIHLIIENLVASYLTETAEISKRYRQLFAVFNMPNVDTAVFTAYTLTDESISILIEEGLVEMFQIVQTYLKKETQQHFLDELNHRAKEEIKYRRSRGYASILDENSENETYTYHVSVLKKYAASVLHLSTAVRRDGWGLEQILFALAAGFSMIFATLVAFYSQYHFGNLTFPFFIALVLAYMLKDRIKELGRYLFASQMQTRLYDRRIDIRTQDGKHKLGVLREKMSFVQEADVPKPVLKIRNRDLFSDLDNDGVGETIICYTKDIVLYRKAFERVYANVAQITGLNDIIRYDIRPFLRKMAEPVQQRPYLKDGELYVAECQKVYHINLVSRYRALQPQKEKLHRRLRLVLNQEGLKRIEYNPQ